MGNSDAKPFVAPDNLSKEEVECLQRKFEPNSKGYLPKPKFCSVFFAKSFTNFGEAFYNQMKKPDAEMLHFAEFCQVVAFSSKTNPVNSAKMIYEVIKHNKPNDSNENTLLHFLKLLVEFAGASAENNDSLARKLYAHFEGYTKADNQSVSFEALNSWANSYFPCYSRVFLQYLNSKYFGDITSSSTQRSKAFKPSYLSYPETNTTQKAPGKNDNNSNNSSNAAIPPPNISRIITQEEMVLLSLTSDMLQGRWLRLYCSDTDGLSFNRIAHHILGYEGPCVIIIKCAFEEQSTIFGMFSTSRWKDSNRFYGTADNFIFTIAPKLNIYRTRPNTNNNFQYLNLKTYGYAHGLGMGGTMDKFRIFLPDNLDDGVSAQEKVCTANDSCMTFEYGEILPKRGGEESVRGEGKFNIETLEIWACGDDQYIREGLRAQHHDRMIRDENVNKARQCDKAAFAGNAFDQEFLLPKNFAHKVRIEDREQAEED